MKIVVHGNDRSTSTLRQTEYKRMLIASHLNEKKKQILNKEENRHLHTP